MAVIKQVTGTKAIIQKMRVAKTKTGNDVAVGLKRGGLFLQRESMKVAPVQLGTLKNTAFCRNIGGIGFKADIIVGYTAKYAAVVHEDLEKAHGEDFNVKHADEISAAVGTRRGTARGGMFKRGKGQQAKYLEAPARMFRRSILEIIYGTAKL